MSTVEDCTLAFTVKVIIAAAGTAVLYVVARSGKLIALCAILYRLINAICVEIAGDNNHSLVNRHTGPEVCKKAL